ncbi:PGL/p-HBAD biosynthesis glycosyltransferase/MT3031 [Thalassovita mediterranea]|jgi:rSAM/selenodomain-associated transferase 2|uniref:PGL/p-HBAD biosynthesis glycosyltransferase/MT3031 n=1 Tax=Thalassovita mediterranea TaxID=340021 RepID=A0A0N7M1N7_9RHOB|nr:PGL/p-HBAD biosynthesis glycosyltransferase/MT3031 [Thalassovita mediterranea]SIS28363.1 hypothetical protein SAMN05421685_101493 [Thalassovita mediterranea]
MRAAVSVVIPTWNAAAGLAVSLPPLMEGLQAGVIRELVVSDAGSTDDTVRIAEEVGAKLITGAPSRGGQMRRGAEVAEGDWLLFLHADTELPAGWSDHVLAHIEEAPERAAYFRLSFAERGLRAKWVAGWANLRSRMFGLPYGDQALLISRALYDQVGGFPDQPLMEDVAMARALKGRLSALSISVRTSGAKYVTEGWFRRGRRNLWILLRYFCGADPHALAQSYRQSARRS